MRLSRLLRLPNPFALLVVGVFLAAALTWVLPAGEYRRVDDPVTGRRVVVAGSYERVAPAPVGVFGALVAIPRGLIAGGSVVFFVFLVGGAFSVVDQTNALRLGVEWLAQRLHSRALVVVVIVSLAFAAGGALENMQEEIIALIPALLLLVQRLGFDALTAAAMSVGSAGVAAAFSPVNPFQALIAQQLAGLPALSAGMFRAVCLTIALVVWIGWTLRHARRVQARPMSEAADSASFAFDTRHAVILGIVLATFAVFVYGVTALGWDFEQESAVFFAMGVLAGLVGGLGVSGTAEAFIRGFRDMAFAAMLIGVARAISVVFAQGKVLDTIVRGLFAPVSRLPLLLAAAFMVIAHLAIHVPVPSVSSQAALTMPLLVPLSDLLALSRQVTVLAYQYGAGMGDLLTPTNGALMAVLAAAGVGYGQWMRFVLPVAALLLGIGIASMAVAIAIGLK